MQLRREANFAVNDAVGGEVFVEFARDADEVISVLHDFQREIDAHEIIGEIEANFRGDQRGFKRSGKVQADFAGQGGDGCYAHRCIEMAVELDLGEGFEVDRHFAGSEFE